MLAVRLIGSTILAADVNELTPTHFKVSYTVRDEGEYLLQVRLVWLTGAGLAHDAFLNVAELGMKSLYLDCMIYNETVNVIGLPEQHLHRSDKPLCTRNNDISQGRWVKVSDHNKCLLWACESGTDGTNWLNDLFGFNTGYVWSPWECNLKIYSPLDVETCIIKNNISTIAFVGDSLAREHFQNLVSLISINGHEMKKILKLMEFPFVLSNGMKLRVLFSPDIISIPDTSNSWLLWNLHLMRLLTEGDFDLQPLFYLRDQQVKAMLNLQATYYLHPQIQREDVRVIRDGDGTAKASVFAFINPVRQAIQAHQIRSAAFKYNSSLLDGQSATRARWESTWDGIHYSMVSITSQLANNASCMSGFRRGGRDMCNSIKTLPGISKCENGYVYWCKHVYDDDTVFGSFEGGVSRMLTMMWINMMCS